MNQKVVPSFWKTKILNMENNLQKYKDLFDTMELGVVYQDNRGKILEANHAAEQILGLSLAQMKGLDSDSDKWKAVREDGSVFPGNEHPAMIALRRGKKVKDTVMGIYNQRLGQRRWININAVPEFMKGEKIAYQVYTTFQDITERKSVELELRESEEKFRNLADESPNMIFINHRGRIVYANNICEKYTKYKTREFYDERFSFLSLIDEDDVERVEENFRKHQSGSDVTPYEYKLKCKDGSRLDVIITTKLIAYQNENAILGIVTDITKFKKAEEQVKLTQFGIDKSQIGIFQVDDNGSIYYVNDHGCKSLGYHCSELCKLKIWDIDPNLNEEKWHEHRKMTRSLGNTTIESVHRRKDGTRFPVEITINFVEFGNKKVSFSFARDITERKQAEKALRESEERLKLAVEGTKAGLWDWNLQTGETTYSERWAEIVGYTLEELKPISIKTWMNLCHPDDIKKSDELLDKHFKGELEFYEFEVRMKHKDGHWIWVLDKGKVSQWDKTGNPVRITGTHIDITERKKAEEEYRLSEIRFRRIFEEGQFGITIAGPDYKFINANPAFCRMIGYTVDEMKTMTFADITHPERVDTDKDKVIALSKGEINQIKTEKRYIKKNGKILWGSLISTAVRDDEGQILYYLAMVQDITDRKRTEESLQQQNKEYHALNVQYLAQNEELVDSLERIQKINKELIKAKEKAEESDRLKTAFLANMSHEIRTPMNGIIGFTDLLKEPKLSGEEQKAYIEVIQQSGYRMLNIINDLIDIARIEAGQVEVKIENTCINHLLNGVYTFFKPETEMKKLSFSCKKELSDADSYMKTDPTKLNQILSNLIKNAIKFTRTGSINFGYAIRNKDIEFYVTDTGIGIASELKEKIFERFRRGDISDTTEYEGVGLGLSITRAFVKMLGGKIWLESNQNKGTTFFFSLPFDNARGTKRQTKPKKAEQIQSRSQHTILAVEDDDASFRFIQEVLNRNGLNAIRAMNGEEAIRLTKQNPEIELVLMDIKMPVMNGLDATREIKQLRPELPVIAETAYASEEDRQKSLDAGCDDFIPKPISKERLIELIHKYIQPS